MEAKSANSGGIAWVPKARTACFSLLIVEPTRERRTASSPVESTRRSLSTASSAGERPWALATLVRFAIWLGVDSPLAEGTATTKTVMNNPIRIVNFLLVSRRDTRVDGQLLKCPACCPVLNPQMQYKAAHAKTA